MEKNFKIFIAGNYGYCEKLYNDSYDYKFFKDHFIESFKPEARDQVKNNLIEIEYIYNNNYACFEGFYDSIFDAFFRCPKIYQKARSLLKSKKFNKKQFWALGIL